MERKKYSTEIKSLFCITDVTTYFQLLTKNRHKVIKLPIHFGKLFTIRKTISKTSVNNANQRKPFKVKPGCIISKHSNLHVIH